MGVEVELEDLLKYYDDGLYTAGEVASLCLEMMGRDANDAIWSAFPDWVKNRMIERLKNFSEKDEVVTFGHGDPQQAKSEMLCVKAWLIGKGLI